MKRRMTLRKRIVPVILVIITICIATVTPYVYKGYRIYNSVVTAESIDEKVAEIRNYGHFVKLNQISDSFKSGIIHSEDKRFRYHFGLDPIAIARAAFYDIKAGSFVQGGSTITQQLAKNMYFGTEKTMERKIAEAFVAFDLEKHYSKDEILELYCNKIYYGNGCNGIEEASNYYFGVNAGELSENQADRLIYTVRCPEYYNPDERIMTAGL